MALLFDPTELARYGGLTLVARNVVEGFLTAAFKSAGIALTTPFVQMTYDDAIKNYGIDKPDMRLPAMVSLTEELTPELRESLKIEQALPVLGFVIPGHEAPGMRPLKART